MDSYYNTNKPIDLLRNSRNSTFADNCKSIDNAKRTNSKLKSIKHPNLYIFENEISQQIVDNQLSNKSRTNYGVNKTNIKILNFNKFYLTNSQEKKVGEIFQKKPLFPKTNKSKIEKFKYVPHIRVNPADNSIGFSNSKEASILDSKILSSNPSNRNMSQDNDTNTIIQTKIKLSNIAKHNISNTSDCDSEIKASTYLKYLKYTKDSKNNNRNLLSPGQTYELNKTNQTESNRTFVLADMKIDQQISFTSSFSVKNSTSNYFGSDFKSNVDIVNNKFSSPEEIHNLTVSLIQNSKKHVQMVDEGLSWPVNSKKIHKLKYHKQESK